MPQEQNKNPLELKVLGLVIEPQVESLVAESGVNTGMVIVYMLRETAGMMIEFRMTAPA